MRPKGFTEPPPGRGLARYENQQIDWESCGHGFLCGTMLVPLDYADPDGTAITLMVAKRPATGDKRLGSLIINPGGPGGSGVGYVGYFNAAGLENYDIVGWDPRGVGRSTPVTCFGKDDLDHYFSMDSSPDDPLESCRPGSMSRSRSDDPASTDPVRLLEHISTTETVRDLDLLRQLVGDSQDQLLWFLLRDHGSARSMRELFPHRVGRMVLDGAVDLNSTSKISQVDGFERALDHFATWCAETQVPARVSA